MRKALRLVGLSGLFFFLGSSVCSAATFTVFDTRTAFESAVTGGVTEDFNSLAPLPVSFSRKTLDLGLFSITGVSVFGDFIDGSGSSFNIDGTTFGRARIAPSDFTLEFSFDDPITAFALDLNRLNNTNVVRSNLRIDGEFLALGADANGLDFIGFVSVNPFSRIIFEPTAVGGNIFGFDNLTYSPVSDITPVPLPASVVLFPLGLIIVRFFKRS